MKYIPIMLLCSLFACNNASESQNQEPELRVLIDSLWIHEQRPITIRDSLIRVHGAESPEAEVYQKIFRANHAENIIIVKGILNKHGWPDSSLIGTNGNLTLANILQHSDQQTREDYLPLMKQAVLNGKLEARLLVRAQDRLATDRGELQIYGGQMKYYPETKSFNVWPVFDPENIDKRRAEIGLGPIAEHLKRRFDFEWNLEEQIDRTEEFLRERESMNE